MDREAPERRTVYAWARDTVLCLGRKGGLSLISLEERMRHLGGSFTVSSEPGNGTALTIDLPVAVARR